MTNSGGRRRSDWPTRSRVGRDVVERSVALLPAVVVARCAEYFSGSRPRLRLPRSSRADRARENGSGLSISASTTEKIAAFAPMPSASTTMTVIANPRSLSSTRAANLRSCISSSSQLRPAALAIALSRLFDSAQRNHRLAPRLFSESCRRGGCRPCAGPDGFRVRHRQLAPHALHRAHTSIHQPAESLIPNPCSIRYSFFVARNLASIAVVFSHSRSSFSICLRPARVSR